jgi:sugar phosphate isomerase/epimerase
MKTCVSSYSFQKLLNSGEYTQLSLISEVKNMGFDAIEFTNLAPPKDISATDYAHKLREESDRCKLPIANYTIGAELLNCHSLDDEVARLMSEVDIAAILGAKGVRHDATGGYKGVEKSYKSFDDALRTLVEGCRRVTEYAGGKGIKTMVENHGFFCQESTRVEKLVTGVGKENFGMLLDMGNFLCADESPELAFGRLAPFAKHIHAKDFHVKSGQGIHPGAGFFTSRAGNFLRGAIIGHGDVPILQCLTILKKNGYDGYVSIEFEGIEENMMAIETGLNNLERFIEMAENYAMI